MVTKEQKVAFLTANCGDCDEEDLAVLNGLSDKALDNLIANAKKKAKEADDDEDKDKDDDDDDDEVENDKAQGSNADASGSGSIQAGGEEGSPDKHDPAFGEAGLKTNDLTANELDNLSIALFGRPVKDVRSVVQNVMKNEQREKNLLVNRLVANIRSNDLQKRWRGEYQQWTLNQLQREWEKQQAILPPPLRTRVAELVPQYLGSSVSNARPGFNSSDKDDVLPDQKIDWAKLSKGGPDAYLE